MDGQNFNNGQQNTTNYQDNTMMYQQAPMQGNPQGGEPKQTNVLAIISLICGIASIVCCCCNWVGVLLGIVGIVCAVLAKKQGESGMATAGLICGIVGSVLSLIMFIIVIAGMMDGSITSDLGGYYY